MHPTIRRVSRPFLLPLIAVAAAHAQDPIQQGILANQQAIQQMQQSAQLSIQQSQQATRDMQAQQDLINARNAAAPAAYVVATPSLSIKAGIYPAPVVVRLQDRTRGAVIYYTTDGWTPTTHSVRYVGPISISATTTLQAIAVDGGNGRSRISSATYTLPVTTAVAPSFVGHGAPVRVVFTAPFTSKGAQVGDSVPLALAEDLHVGKLVLAKGTPVAATVTHVDGPGWSGLPASLTFELHSVTIGADIIPLVGTETKDGPQQGAARQILPFDRGSSVEIPAGAELTAVVAPS